MPVRFILLMVKTFIFQIKSDFNIENVKRRKEVVFIFVIGIGRINDVLSTIRCQVMDFVILGR